MRPVLRVLSSVRGVRGTPLDVFGYTSERRTERALIRDYERVLDEIANRLSPQTHAVALALADLPLEIKGFGHVKAASIATAKAREAELLAQLRNPSPAPALAAAE